MSLVPEEVEMCNKVHRVDSAPSWEPYAKVLAAKTIFSFSHWWQRAADKHLNIQWTELAQHISSVLFPHLECPFTMPWAPTRSMMFLANGCWVTICRISQSWRASHMSWLHSDLKAQLFSLSTLSALAVLLSELPSAFHPAVWWDDFHICSPVWNSGVWKGCCWPKLTFTENRPRKGCSACNLSIYFFGKWFTLWLCSDCVPGKTTIFQLISFNTVFLLICNLIWIKMPSISAYFNN